MTAGKSENNDHTIVSTESVTLAGSIIVLPILSLIHILYHDIEKHAFDDTNNGYIEALTREWNPIADMLLDVMIQGDGDIQRLLVTCCTGILRETIDGKADGISLLLDVYKRQTLCLRWYGHCSHSSQPSSPSC